MPGQYANKSFSGGCIEAPRAGKKLCSDAERPALLFNVKSRDDAAGANNVSESKSDGNTVNFAHQRKRLAARCITDQRREKILGVYPTLGSERCLRPASSTGELFIGHGDFTHVEAQRTHDVSS
ncbi:MAG: hypothetical protein NWR88_08580 [Ilumatobacteraceae bacterium]|nr:hypothetical protein [Ilumatobacteraceae bacterium]